MLPAGAEPIRVLHLSDLHMAPWQRDKQAWVRSLAELEPDLIVDTGDNLGHERGIEGVRRAFDAFAGIPGVFVNGSNDYFGPAVKNPFTYFGGPSGVIARAKRLDIGELHAYFAELGWHDLDNTAASLDLRGTHFEFFGVDDPHRGYDRLDLITAAIDELRAEDPLGDEVWPDAASASLPRPTVTVGVTHAPYQRVLNSFVNHGAQLVLAGHTHGGQVCVPGFGSLVTNELSTRWYGAWATPTVTVGRRSPTTDATSGHSSSPSGSSARADPRSPWASPTRRTSACSTPS